MKISDIIATKEFHEQLTNKVNAVISMRKISGQVLKRDAFGRLMEKGIMQNSDNLAVAYINVITNSCNTTEFPKALRDCIKYFGDYAMHQAYVQLKEKNNEK